MQEKNASGESMYGFLACTVSRFMTRNVLTIMPQTTMQELAVLFEKHDFNAFPVVESGNLIGIVREI
jgi:predicted transcriptional regulator